MALVEGKGASAFKRTNSRGLEVGVFGGPVHEYALAHAFGLGGMPVRPPVRYNETIHGAGQIMGTKVSLTTAIAQIFQVHIVAARKKAMSDSGLPVIFEDETRVAKIEAVMNLETF